MSPDEFWDGEPILAKAYREAYKLRMQDKNRELWLQGLYIYHALCDVSPVLHAFAKNGTKPLEYLPEPVAITKEEFREKKERDTRQRYEKQKIAIDSWMIANNRRITQAEKEVSKDG